jgi:hypothetical protein
MIDYSVLFVCTHTAHSLVYTSLLVSLSAIFSGLTLGVLGLDKTGLEIVMGKSMLFKLIEE